jgi:hypothetical protein
MMMPALKPEAAAAGEPESVEARLARLTAASRVFLHTVQNLLGVPTILVGALDTEPLSDDTRTLAADAQMALDQIIVEARTLQVIVWDLAARPSGGGGDSPRGPRG